MTEFREVLCSGSLERYLLLYTVVPLVTGYRYYKMQLLQDTGIASRMMRINHCTDRRAASRHSVHPDLRARAGAACTCGTNALDVGPSPRVRQHPEAAAS